MHQPPFFTFSQVVCGNLISLHLFAFRGSPTTSPYISAHTSWQLTDQSKVCGVKVCKHVWTCMNLKVDMRCCCFFVVVCVCVNILAPAQMLHIGEAAEYPEPLVFKELITWAEHNCHRTRRLKPCSGFCDILVILLCANIHTQNTAGVRKIWMAQFAIKTVTTSCCALSVCEYVYENENCQVCMYVCVRVWLWV